MPSPAMPGVPVTPSVRKKIAPLVAIAELSLAATRARINAGSAMAATTARVAATTSSSMSVKPAAGAVT